MTAKVTVQERDITTREPFEAETLYEELRNTDVSAAYAFPSIDAASDGINVGLSTIPRLLRDLLRHGKGLRGKKLEDALPSVVFAESSLFPDRIALGARLRDFLSAHIRTSGRQSLRDMEPEQVRDRISEAYVRVYTFLQDTRLGVYHAPLFINEPREARGFFSFYGGAEAEKPLSKAAATVYRDVKDHFERFEKSAHSPNPEVAEIDWHRRKEDSDWSVFESFRELLPGAERRNEHDREEMPGSIAAFHELFHTIAFRPTDERKRFYSSTLLSIPVVSASAGHKVGAGGETWTLIGLGAVFVFLAYRKRPAKGGRLSVDDLSMLAGEISRTFKDVFSSYLYGNAKELVQKTLRFARQSAISTIMGRVNAHDMGHVLAGVNARHLLNSVDVEEFYSHFSSFLRKRMVFATEAASGEPSWGLSMPLFTQVLAPFISWRPGVITEEHAKDAFPKEDQASAVVLHIAESEGFNSIRFRLWRDGRPLTSLNDESTLVPTGAVGVHALYCILENLIRNGAKYGRTGRDATDAGLMQTKCMEVFLEVSELPRENGTRVENLIQVIILEDSSLCPVDATLFEGLLDFRAGGEFDENPSYVGLRSFLGVCRYFPWEVWPPWIEQLFDDLSSQADYFLQQSREKPPPADLATSAKPSATLRRVAAICAALPNRAFEPKSKEERDSNVPEEKESLSGDPFSWIPEFLLNMQMTHPIASGLEPAEEHDALTDDMGKLISGGFGIKEMRICAAWLRHLDPNQAFDRIRPEPPLLEPLLVELRDGGGLDVVSRPFDGAAEKPRYLGFRFWLQRPLFALLDRAKPPEADELIQKGVECIPDVLNHVKPWRHSLALVNLNSERRREWDHPLSMKHLYHLPMRVIAPEGGARSSPRIAFIPKEEFEDLCDRMALPSQVDNAICDAYSVWIRTSLLSSNSPGERIILVVPDDASIVNAWSEAAKALNCREWCFEVMSNTAIPPDIPRGLDDWATSSRVYDYHADLAEVFGDKRGLLRDRVGFYERCGNEVGTILLFKNPPRSVETRKRLLLGLLEAALFRAVVVDERIWLSSAPGGGYRRAELRRAGIMLPPPDVINYGNPTVEHMRSLKEYCTGGHPDTDGKPCHALTIHQGILDKAFKDIAIEDAKRELGHWFERLSESMCVVLAHSDRGKAEMLPRRPNNVATLPYSSIEGPVVQHLSKFEFVQILSSARGPGEEP